MIENIFRYIRTSPFPYNTQNSCISLFWRKRNVSCENLKYLAIAREELKQAYRYLNYSHSKRKDVSSFSVIGALGELWCHPPGWFIANNISWIADINKLVIGNYSIPFIVNEYVCLVSCKQTHIMAFNSRTPRRSPWMTGGSSVCR